MPPSRLAADISRLGKQKLIPATVVDVLNDRCSVKLSTRGSLLRNLKYFGSIPIVGALVYVDYRGGTPIVQTYSTGEEEAATVETTSSSTGKSLETPKTYDHNDQAGLQGGTPAAGPAPAEYYHLTSAEYSGLGNSNITIQESDSSPSVVNPAVIKVSNGRLTDEGGGTVLISIPADPIFLTVREDDEDYGTVVTNVGEIIVPYGRLTNNGGGSVTLAIPSPLTVEEVDLGPSVANVNKIVVTNGKLTDSGGGVVTLDLAGDPFNLTVSDDGDYGVSFSNVNELVFTDGTVTDLGDGRIHISVGGMATIEVTEVDTDPDAMSVNKLIFPNGSVTDNEDGSVTIAFPSALGDVVGPAGATDHAVVRFDGVSGKLIEESGMIIADTGHVGLGVAPHADRSFYLEETFTDKTGSLTNAGYWSEITVVATDNVTSYHRSTCNYITGGAASGKTILEVAGVTSRASVSATHLGTITTLTGFSTRMNVYNGAAGAVGTHHGIYVSENWEATNTTAITDNYRIYLAASSNLNGGSITNNYGLYIGSITAGGTLNYSIYTESGVLRFGDRVLQYGVPTSAGLRGFYGVYTPTDTSGYIYSHTVETHVNPGNNSSGVFYGAYSNLHTESDLAYNLTGAINAFGAFGESNLGTGKTATMVRGIYAGAGIINAHAGAVTWAVAVQTLTYANTGPVTAAAGVRVGTPSVSNGGSITTSYGIYFDAQTSGVTNYALYTNAGLNRFGDQLAIYGSGDRTQLAVRSTAPYRGSTTFTGAGLNDLTSGGTSTSSTSDLYEFEIDATGTPDTFKWRRAGGSYTTGVAITGGAQAIDAYGITVTFAATTGHTLADKWSFTAYVQSTNPMSFATSGGTALMALSPVGHLSVGSGVSPSANILVYAVETNLNTGSSSKYAAYGNETMGATTASITGMVYGLYGLANGYSTNASYTLAGARAIYGGAVVHASHAGGTITQLTGGHFDVSIAAGAAGVVTIGANLRLTQSITAAATTAFTDMAYIYIDAPGASGGSTIANHHGIRINDIAKGTSSNNVLYATGTWTDVNSYGIRIDYTGYASAVSGTTVYGVYSKITARNASAKAVTAYGVYGLVTIHGSSAGASANYLPGYFLLNNATNAAGTSASAAVITASMTFDNAITTAFGTLTGIEITSLPNKRNASITTQYGLLVGAIDKGDTCYSIYSGVGAISVIGSITRASAAGMAGKLIEFRAATLTVTGTTRVTNAAGVNYVDIAGPTYTDASSVTIDYGATLYIAAAPAAGGSVTLTNPYALWVDAGRVRIDEGVAINDAGGDSDTWIEGDTEDKLLYVDAGLDVVKIGDSDTNYTQWDKAGHQKMIGTAQPWEDLRVEPIAKGTGANNPSWTQFMDNSGLGDTGSSVGLYLYAFDDAGAGQEKEVWFMLQLPHAWNQDDISIHVHWIGNKADTTAAPRWGLEYSWAEPGAVFAATLTVYSDGSNYTLSGTDANVVAGEHYISKFAALSPSSSQDGISSILIGRLFRNSSDAGDTYNVADNLVGLLYVDAHYQLSSLGSDDEYTKG